ncbi:hypothetical protein BAUCODRAFT_367757 [Baudoinia panamericana UAMH 10762]|uniref:Uncharacterized protein n=1 Tax=Baudoinia panamericana (strain UAMH 10762) TaxID=717646 RepID=M2LZQ0_BAUPA|nr:uncharacterized protein BAUCODRAFT_367757 [Baudoinia panamericana UAMH 10762]EMD00183.1 hypothetical protein BAUCODRAFT_367757 [Baudoinia panamericana UAMH 10762]
MYQAPIACMSAGPSKSSYVNRVAAQAATGSITQIDEAQALNECIYGGLQSPEDRMIYNRNQADADAANTKGLSSKRQRARHRRSKRSHAAVVERIKSSWKGPVEQWLSEDITPRSQGSRLYGQPQRWPVHLLEALEHVSRLLPDVAEAREALEGVVNARMSKSHERKSIIVKDVEDVIRGLRGKPEGLTPSAHPAALMPTIACADTTLTADATSAGNAMQYDDLRQVTAPLTARRQGKQPVPSATDAISSAASVTGSPIVKHEAITDPAIGHIPTTARRPHTRPPLDWIVSRIEKLASERQDLVLQRADFTRKLANLERMWGHGGAPEAIAGYQKDIESKTRAINDKNREIGKLKAGLEDGSRRQHGEGPILVD